MISCSDTEQNSYTYVRFFRDYCIGDLMFMLLSAVAVGYTAFSSYSLRATICEELGRQPELMRDLADSGLNLENCEAWFERAVVAVLGMIFMFIVIRVSPTLGFGAPSPLTIPSLATLHHRAVQVLQPSAP